MDGRWPGPPLTGASLELPVVRRGLLVAWATGMQWSGRIEGIQPLIHGWIKALIILACVISFDFCVPSKLVRAWRDHLGAVWDTLWLCTAEILWRLSLFYSGALKVLWFVNCFTNALSFSFLHYWCSLPQLAWDWQAMLLLSSSSSLALI